MADRIVRGYWDCPYCDSTDIDGLVDNCPNCGRHKPENTKYHLKGAIPHENINDRRIAKSRYFQRRV